MTNPLEDGANGFNQRHSAERNSRENARKNAKAMSAEIITESSAFLKKNDLQAVSTGIGLCITTLGRKSHRGGPADPDDNWKYVTVDAEQDLRIEALLEITPWPDGARFDDLSSERGGLAKSCGVQFQQKRNENQRDQILRVIGEFTAFHAERQREYEERRAADVERWRVQEERRSSKEAEDRARFEQQEKLRLEAEQKKENGQVLGCILAAILLGALFVTLF